MRETVEFRVVEEFASLLFGPDEGERLGDSVRKVVLPTDDPRYQQVGHLREQIDRELDKSFFLGWNIRRDSADNCCLRPRCDDATRTAAVSEDGERHRFSFLVDGCHAEGLRANDSWRTGPVSARQSCVRRHRCHWRDIRARSLSTPKPGTRTVVRVGGHRTGRNLYVRALASVEVFFGLNSFSFRSPRRFDGLS